MSLKKTARQKTLQGWRPLHERAGSARKTGIGDQNTSRRIAEKLSGKSQLYAQPGRTKRGRFHGGFDSSPAIQHKGRQQSLLHRFYGRIEKVHRSRIADDEGGGAAGQSRMLVFHPRRKAEEAAKIQSLICLDILADEHVLFDAGSSADFENCRRGNGIQNFRRTCLRDFAARRTGIPNPPAISGECLSANRTRNRRARRRSGQTCPQPRQEFSIHQKIARRGRERVHHISMMSGQTSRLVSMSALPQASPAPSPVSSEVRGPLCNCEAARASMASRIPPEPPLPYSRVYP